MTKHEEMQRIIRQYKLETGETDVDMHAVADWAIARGWPLPTPRDPRDIVAAEFARAAREETRHDEVTGRPYRVHHAYPIDDSGQTRWIDIDESAPRPKMVKSLRKRREQIVGDALQLTFDLQHWNRINPAEEPIIVPLDFTEDVEEKIAVYDDGGEKGKPTLN